MKIHLVRITSNKQTNMIGANKNKLIKYYQNEVQAAVLWIFLKTISVTI